MQFLIPLKKKYNIFWGPIKTSLIEHFKTRKRERANACQHARASEKRCSSHCCVAQKQNLWWGRDGIKEWLSRWLMIKLLFNASTGIICMNFTSQLNSPSTVLNKTEIGWWRVWLEPCVVLCLFKKKTSTSCVVQTRFLFSVRNVQQQYGNTVVVCFVFVFYISENVTRRCAWWIAGK